MTWENWRWCPEMILATWEIKSIRKWVDLRIIWRFHSLCLDTRFFTLPLNNKPGSGSVARKRQRHKQRDKQDKTRSLLVLNERRLREKPSLYEFCRTLPSFIHLHLHSHTHTHTPNTHTRPSQMPPQSQGNFFWTISARGDFKAELFAAWARRGRSRRRNQSERSLDVLLVTPSSLSALIGRPSLLKEVRKRSWFWPSVLSARMDRGLLLLF